MTNLPDERISALVDGETAEHEQSLAMDGLLTNDENRKTWGRYHLIGDTLKGNLPSGVDHEFSSRVMAALEDEPTVLAPSTARASWGQRAAGLAVAASVAAVAVLGVQHMYQQDAQAPAQQIAQQVTPEQNPSLMAKKNAQRVGQANMQAAAQSSDQPMVQAASQQIQQSGIAINSASGSPSKNLRKFHPRLNKYLVNHNQQAAQAVQGMVPYARIVAYPNSQRILIQTQK